LSSSHVRGLAAKTTAAAKASPTPSPAKTEAVVQPKEDSNRYFTDEHGERQTRAAIPEDVRTYNWRTPLWAWGSMERLFEDCQQARLRFDMEDYEDENGKMQKRVVQDKNGVHVGVAEGWWFDGESLFSSPHLE
jgi:hypothetical protein